MSCAISFVSFSVLLRFGFYLDKDLRCKYGYGYSPPRTFSGRLKSLRRTRMEVLIFQMESALIFSGIKFIKHAMYQSLVKTIFGDVLFVHWIYGRLMEYKSSGSTNLAIMKYVKDFHLCQTGPTDPMCSLNTVIESIITELFFEKSNFSTNLHYKL